METQTAVLNVMADLRQQPNTPEQNGREHLSQEKFDQRSYNYRNEDHSREEQRKSNQEAGKEKKIFYVRNLHDNVTESELVEFFGLRTTNYLIDNCSIEISKLQRNGRHNGHAFILAPCDVCNELVKLHGLEFQGLKIIIEEAKTPPRTLLNELPTSAVANDQQNMDKTPPNISDVKSKLPTAATEKLSPIQIINSMFSMQLFQRRKTLHFFRTVYREG